jgi:hypothetical protein
MATGDLVVTAMFSRILETISIRVKRGSPPNGIKRFSYVWVSEAQMKRQAKFGGIGDLHFHLVTNQRIDIRWLQATWASYFPWDRDNKNSVHVDPIPAGINSVPAYLSKYLGKGSARRIHSRRFSCSRDLSGLAPIHLNHLPDSLQPISQRIFQTPTGYESCIYYFNTADVLRRYARFMTDEKDFQGTRGGRNFTPSAIQSRRFTREVRQHQEQHAREVGVIRFPGSWVYPTRRNSDRLLMKPVVFTHIDGDLPQIPYRAPQTTSDKTTEKCGNYSPWIVKVLDTLPRVSVSPGSTGSGP